MKDEGCCGEIPLQRRGGKNSKNFDGMVLENFLIKKSELESGFLKLPNNNL